MLLRFFFEHLKDCNIAIYSYHYDFLWSGKSSDILPLSVGKLHILCITVYDNFIFIRVKDK